MRLGSLIVVSALLLVSGSASGARDVRWVAPASSGSLLAAIRPVGPLHAAELARVDAATLKVRAGRRVPLGRNYGAWSFSRDRRRLAIGVDRALGVRLVDLRTMRAIGDVKTPNGDVLALAWLTPRRVVGIDRVGVFVVDPVAKRLVRTQKLEGTFLAAAPTAAALVVLLAPKGVGVPISTVWDWGSTIGPARLVTIAADGSMRTVRVDRIRSGAEISEDGTAHEWWIPGFALDRAGGRAFIVGGDGVVAEADLGTLHVTYHELQERPSLLGRVLSWLEPAAAAKGPMPGPTRQAAWLGDGLLAVAGADVHVTTRSNDVDVATTPYGLRLIDTRNWTMRVVEPHATALTVGSGVLLAYAASYDEQFRPTGGIGLNAYILNGTQRFHILGDSPLFWAEIVGAKAYTAPAGDILGIDLGSGKVVQQLRGPLPQIIR